MVEKQTTKKVRRITDNPDLVAMSKVEHIFSGLDLDAKQRVLSYISAKVNTEQYQHYQKMSVPTSPGYASDSNRGSDPGQPVQSLAGSVGSGRELLHGM